MNIIIIGAGGFGRRLRYLIEECTNDFNVIGFIDDNEIKGKIVEGVEVLGGITDLFHLNEISTLNIAFGIADPFVKRKILKRISSLNLEFPNFIHKTATLKSGVSLGKGNIFCDRVFIGENVVINDFNVFNISCIVGHDVLIHDYCSFMLNVVLSGDNIFENGVYFGSNSCTRNKIAVGEFSTVGAGSVIVKDIIPYSVVVGNPGKIIKYNKE